MQLLLYAEPRRIVEPLPDLERLFAELNRRFFGSGLQAQVEWSTRLVASAGNCRPRRSLIRISVRYYERNPGSLVATLAHEMLHLLVPGHGAEFRRLGEPIARALGFDWRRFRYADRWADHGGYRYVYACPACEIEFPAQKRKRSSSCGRCSPRGFDARYRLVLTESRQDPGPVLSGDRPARAH